MSRFVIYFSITIFGTLGSYIPVWFMHATFFDLSSILLGGLGSIFGLWIGFKMYKDYLS